MEQTNLFGNYRQDDTIEAELNNNLTIVNAIIQKKNLDAKPEFFILGGAAMIFHELNYNATLDIDTANRISDDIKEDVALFIDDAASEVTLLGCGYMKRAKSIRPDLKAISVKILSKPDLLITKLYSWRRKDVLAIKTSGLLTKENAEIAKQILLEEYTGDIQRLLLERLIGFMKVQGLIR